MDLQKVFDEYMNSRKHYEDSLSEYNKIKAENPLNIHVYNAIPVEEAQSILDKQDSNKKIKDEFLASKERYLVAKQELAKAIGRINQIVRIPFNSKEFSVSIRDGELVINGDTN